MRNYWDKGKVPDVVLSLSKYLRTPIEREWSETQIKVDAEYRKNIPEVKVVEALKEWIDSQWGPPELHAQLWQNVLKAIKEIDENALALINAKQEHYCRKAGRTYEILSPKDKEDFINKDSDTA